MAFETRSKEDLLEAAFAAILALRKDGAIIHCITNTVAQNFTANVLLACGATPSMTVSPDEVEAFSGRADAVLINLGTLDDARQLAVTRSLQVCSDNGKPLVLDPVMCHISAPRLSLAKDIIAETPAIIRANTFEAAALGFTEGENINTKTVFALTGPIDKIHSNNEKIEIQNGHALLSRVTAVGCAQGGLMAALLPKSDSPLVAAIAALLWVGIAGEYAATLAKGPGSFQAHLLDQLYSLTTDDMNINARLS